MFRVEESATLQNTKTEARLLQFAQDDLAFRGFVLIARAVIRLLVIGSGGRACFEQLVRKCRRDRAASTQIFNSPNDQAGEIKQPLA